MKSIKYLLSITIIHILLYNCGGHYHSVTFSSVNLPDSIAIMLENEYGHGGNTGASNHVISLVDRNNYLFGNSIYSYKGQGPHYPRKLFVYQEPVLFIFSEYVDRASDKQQFLMELDSCARMLNLGEERIRVYYKIIQDYFHEEEGINYGMEIKELK